MVMARTDTPFPPEFQRLIEPRPAFVETAAPRRRAPAYFASKESSRT
jgi:hypothetical protein